MFRSPSMVNLAPDIVEAILDGTEPAKLTMAPLRRGIPDDWNEQRGYSEWRETNRRRGAICPPA